MIAVLVGGYPFVRKYEMVSETSYLLKPGDLNFKDMLVKDGRYEDQEVKHLGVVKMMVNNVYNR